MVGRPDHAVDEQVRRRPEQHGRRVRLQIRDLAGEAVGVTQIIGIERGDIAASRCSDPGVARQHGAAIDRHRHQPDARIGPARNAGTRRVGRAVVDDDHLEIDERLRGEAVERGGQQGCAIIHRHDDADDRIGPWADGTRHRGGALGIPLPLHGQALTGDYVELRGPPLSAPLAQPFAIQASPISRSISSGTRP